MIKNRFGTNHRFCWVVETEQTLDTCDKEEWHDWLAGRETALNLEN